MEFGITLKLSESATVYSAEKPTRHACRGATAANNEHGPGRFAPVVHLWTVGTGQNISAGWQSTAAIGPPVCPRQWPQFSSVP